LRHPLWRCVCGPRVCYLPVTAHLGIQHAALSPHPVRLPTDSRAAYHLYTILQLARDRQAGNCIFRISLWTLGLPIRRFASYYATAASPSSSTLLRDFAISLSSFATIVDCTPAHGLPCDGHALLMTHWHLRGRRAPLTLAIRSDNVVVCATVVWFWRITAALLRFISKPWQLLDSVRAARGRLGTGQFAYAANKSSYHTTMVCYRWHASLGVLVPASSSLGHLRSFSVATLTSLGCLISHFRS